MTIAGVPSSRWVGPAFVRSPSVVVGLRLVLAAGALVFLAGLFLAPQRVWGGFLMGFSVLVALALAGPVFLSFLAMAGARWSVALQRVPEAMASALPVAFGMGVVLLFGVGNLYEWSHEAAVEHDPLLQHKAPWLDHMFFALRLVLVFLCWIVFARRVIRQSVRASQPGGQSEAARATRLRTAASFIVVVAITYSVASYDWLMSLEPHWFSTLFPLLQFAGVGCAGLAAATLLVLTLERQGALHGVLREDHLHDLGKLMLAFTLFWAYCWYSQYMLIWYTDIPEETAYYASRQEGPWWLLVQATLIMKWAVPFLALLARRTCRTRKVLGRVAVLVLVGHALDIYVQVGPPLMGDEPVVGLWELGPLLGSVALFFLVTLSALEKREVVPVDHPHLADSLSYQTP